MNVVVVALINGIMMIYIYMTTVQRQASLSEVPEHLTFHSCAHASSRLRRRSVCVHDARARPASGLRCRSSELSSRLCQVTAPGARLLPGSLMGKAHGRIEMKTEDGKQAHTMRCWAPVVGTQQRGAPALLHGKRSRRGAQGNDDATSRLATARGVATAAAA